MLNSEAKTFSHSEIFQYKINHEIYKLQTAKTEELMERSGIHCDVV